MKAFRYCSWSPEDLLRDPRVRRMSAEPFGGYCSLLMELWLDPSGSLPDDDYELALLSRMGHKGWAKYGAIIRPLFYTENGKLLSPLIDEIRMRTEKRSEQAKNAVSKRIEKMGVIEPEKSSSDNRAIIDRSSKEKEKEKVNKKEKEKEGESSSKSTKIRNSYSDDFESFQFNWKRLKSTRGFNKFAVSKIYEKALKIATHEEIMEGLERYERHLNLREKKQDDVRSFIPLAETWLNKCSWMTDYQIEAEQFSEPKEGIDYWLAYDETTQGVFMACIKNGHRIKIPFDIESWRKLQNRGSIYLSG